MVTLIGFYAIILHYVLNIYYSPSLDSPNIPTWVFLVNAVCLFWYMTLGTFPFNSIDAIGFYYFKKRR
jgi:hypothetical protein